MKRSYAEYWEASPKAAKLPAGQAWPMLAPLLTPKNLEAELKGAAQWRAKNWEPWGYVTIHILRIEVTGKRAKLWDCQNQSSFGVADSRTHRLISDTRGSAKQLIENEFELGNDGRWQQSKRTYSRKPCMPPSS